MIDVDKLYYEWLEVKKEEVKALSYDKYESTGRLYILPFLKKQPIESLNVPIIIDFLIKCLMMDYLIIQYKL
ncbi:MAG: hypothetical protein LUG60_06660 [Erysipelotrichaceae bacterium]|nr:hypothetical protein [Erysipelotrichaceae bacterium]